MTYHCCVYSKKTPDDGQRNCPKHVEVYSKNKFEKLVHLVGFIIRIYHDARSPERQIHMWYYFITHSGQYFSGYTFIYCYHVAMQLLTSSCNISLYWITTNRMMVFRNSKRGMFGKLFSSQSCSKWFWKRPVDPLMECRQLPQNLACIRCNKYMCNLNYTRASRL